MRHPLRAFARWSRRPLVAAFRVTSESREALVASMLDTESGERAMYWLRLVLSMCIATLGLALGSTVVVIGAMLISPLMAPIVALGMGLAIGLPGLAARSFGRVAASAIVVVATSAIVTLALPFHEITGPIAERSSPTALDLLVAICCALMAAFGTVASNRVSATMASGTALAIALVPPLCVVGFGIGTQRLDVARGAALLFVANFSAIMFFAVLVFVAFGFGEVRAGEAAASEARLGPLWRIALPAALLAVVYVPLRHALADVAWEVSARQAVRRELDPLSKEAVRSDVRVSRGGIDVDVVVVGDPAHAHALERTLGDRIAAATQTVPHVVVVAVPDSAAVQRALAERVTPPAAVVAPSPPLSQRVATVLAEAWPSAAAGELVTWNLAVDDRGRTTLDVVHVGAPLGAAGEELLAEQLTPDLPTPPRVVDHALPRTSTCARDAPPSCFHALEVVLGEVTRWDPLFACVVVPVDVASDGGAPPASVRVRLSEGAAWTVEVRTQPCDEPDAGAAEGGGADASPDAERPRSSP